MATVKIPISYTYKSYPQSPVATRYSAMLAERKAKHTGVLFAISGAVLLMGVSLLLLSRYPEIDEKVMLLAMALGIWAGIDVNRMINKWYEMCIEEALMIVKINH